VGGWWAQGAGQWGQKRRTKLYFRGRSKGAVGGTTSAMAGHGDVELPTDRGAAIPASECGRAQHQRRQQQQ
jgi:hypothetical protein